MYIQKSQVTYSLIIDGLLFQMYSEVFRSFPSWVVALIITGMLNISSGKSNIYCGIIKNFGSNFSGLLKFYRFEVMCIFVYIQKEYDFIAWIYLFVWDVNSWMRATHEFQKNWATTKSNASTVHCIWIINLWRLMINLEIGS